MTVTAPTMTTPDIFLSSGMVGIPGARNFTLSGGADGVFEMECQDHSDLGFVMIAPGPYFPDYTPTLDDTVVKTLGLESPEDALVLLVVTLGDEAQPPCANLMAPVVVNQTTRQAVQVVLADQGYPLRAPFLQG